MRVLNRVFTVCHCEVCKNFTRGISLSLMKCPISKSAANSASVSSSCEYDMQLRSKYSKRENQIKQIAKQ